jgi:hypothetical protein
MNDLKVRITIAENNGYFWFRFLDSLGVPFYMLCEPNDWVRRQGGVRLQRPTIDPTDKWQSWSGIPDYLNDLNAMHKVIIGITDPNMQKIFVQECYKLDDFPAGEEGIYCLMSLPAQSLAEAYVRAVAKCEELSIAEFLAGKLT